MFNILLQIKTEFYNIFHHFSIQSCIKIFQTLFHAKNKTWNKINMENTS